MDTAEYLQTYRRVLRAGGHDAGFGADGPCLGRVLFRFTGSPLACPLVDLASGLWPPSSRLRSNRTMSSFGPCFG